MPDLEVIHSRYQQLYPKEVAEGAQLVLAGSDTLLGTHLESALDHLHTTLLVIGARMAEDDDGDAIDALAKLREVARGKNTSGTYISYFEHWNDFDSTRAVFDPGERVDSREAPLASRFRRVWQSVAKPHGGPETWNPDELDEESVLAALRAELPDLGTRWRDLVLAVVEFRNKLSHHDKSAPRQEVPEPLMLAAKLACLEVAVVGPPADLLRQYRLGTKASIGEDPARGVYDVWEARTPVGNVWTPRAEINGRAAKGDRWLIRLPQVEQGGLDLYEQPWGSAVGPWRQPNEILRDSQAPVEMTIDQRAEALLGAGVVDVRAADGGAILIGLPTELRVMATVDAGSAATSDDLKVTLPDRFPALEELVLGTVASTLRRLSDEEPPSTGTAIPSGLSGSVVIDSDSRARCHPGVQQAVVLATARAVARSIVGKLDDGVQIKVMRDVMGDDHHDAPVHRDKYGWVSVDDGSLVGGIQACPAAGLLLLVPVGSGRSVSLDGIDVADADDLDVSSLESVATLCTRTAELLDRLHPHPLLPVVRSVAKLFEAEGLFVSHDSWTLGLIFKSDDTEKLLAAVSHLERLKQQQQLPPSLQLVTTKTAATKTPEMLSV